MKWHNVPIMKETNSVFGLPEPYDDLLDEWTHKAHINERNRCSATFSKFRRKKSIFELHFLVVMFIVVVLVDFERIQKLLHYLLNDSKLMYQIISSAIVNRPPPKQFIQAAHFFRTKWHPINNTEEKLINFF